MNAKELIKELKKYPGDSPVCLCLDWESVDEEGHLDKLVDLDDVCVQTIYVDEGLDWRTENQIILDFKTVK